MQTTLYFLCETPIFYLMYKIKFIKGDYSRLMTKFHINMLGVFNKEAKSGVWKY
jgi:hypothetical protein